MALNAERSGELAVGHFRWLRPDYQIPRFAKRLPAFPTDRCEQPLGIEDMLAAAARRMTAADLSRGFKRAGKRIEQRVVQVLDTLARYGHVKALPYGAVSARRAA